MMASSIDTETANSGWRGLYRLAGVTTAFSLLIIPLSVVVYLMWPPPDTVLDHFAQFEQNWLVGMLGMDLLYLLGNLALIPTWLAFYVTLKRTNQSLTAVALALGLIATVALIASRPILEMQMLSEQYSLAATPADKAIYVAAGETLLAVYHGTAFNLHYILGTVALLLISFVMGQSDVFSKRTAQMGITANVVTLGYYIPVVGIDISIFSVLFYLIWYFLIARRLLQLS